MCLDPNLKIPANKIYDKSYRRAILSARNSPSRIRRYIDTRYTVTQPEKPSRAPTLVRKNGEFRRSKSRQSPDSGKRTVIVHRSFIPRTRSSSQLDGVPSTPAIFMVTDTRDTADKLHSSPVPEHSFSRRNTSDVLPARRAERDCCPRDRSIVEDRCSPERGRRPPG